RLIRSLPELRVEEDLLTPTEHEVLRLATEGLTNREIAERLGISRGTVVVHLMDIRRRIGVRTREEAIAAFGKPTVRVRIPFPAARAPTPEEVERVRLQTQLYERKVGSLLTMVDELERSPSMEKVGILENELLDLVEEVGRAREPARGREAVILGALQGALEAIIREDIAPVRASLILLERETLPMRIEAAKRSFLSTIRLLRKSLTIISLS
ncbi:unnamed protein product, partial [marine sediment metagenome]